MNHLAAGASTQSRARRPVPWPGVVVTHRFPVSERWRLPDGTDRELLTWTFDQGGPVLGYTCRSNKLTRELLKRASDAEVAGLYGPGSITSELEIEAARELVGCVGDHIRRGDDEGLLVRFFANGSDALDAAVRVARHTTGRDRIVSIGYHGSSLWFSHPPQDGGAPESDVLWRTDLEFGRTIPLLRGCACIIVEIPSTDEGASDYLDALRSQCDAVGALLVLDEVVTGFRLNLGGAAEHYGITPDLACYGKAMSNGRGISALVGGSRLMASLADKVFYSNTYNGDPYNLAHVVGTLSVLQRLDYQALWDVGNQLKEKMPIKIIGHGPRTVTVGWDDTTEQQLLSFKRLMAVHGVVMDRPNYATFAHRSEHIKRTARAAELAVRDMRLAGLIGGSS